MAMKLRYTSNPEPKRMAMKSRYASNPEVKKLRCFACSFCDRACSLRSL